MSSELGLSSSEGGGERCRQPCEVAQILYTKAFNLKLCSNEDYYTACSLLVMLKNSCGKLHHQKVPGEEPSHVKSRHGIPLCKRESRFFKRTGGVYLRGREAGGLGRRAEYPEDEAGRGAAHGALVVLEGGGRW